MTPGNGDADVHDRAPLCRREEPQPVRGAIQQCELSIVHALRLGFDLRTSVHEHLAVPPVSGVARVLLERDLAAHAHVLHDAHRLTLDRNLDRNPSRAAGIHALHAS